jgi:hypothetical protein
MCSKVTVRLSTLILVQKKYFFLPFGFALSPCVLVSQTVFDKVAKFSELSHLPDGNSGILGKNKTLQSTTMQKLQGGGDESLPKLKT